MSNENPAPQTQQNPQTQQPQKPSQVPSTAFAEEKTSSRKTEPVYVKPGRRDEE